MTVTAASTRNQYVGNGVTVNFAYGFKILQASDLRVTVNGVVVSNYSVSGVRSPTGGTVTFTVAPAAGDSILIRRAMAYLRGTDYQFTGDLPADTLNDDQDSPVMMIQQLADQVARAIVAPDSDAAPQLTLPEAALRANRVLAFDSSGNAIGLVGVDASSASALALDLASSNAAAKGAGQVGYARALAYGAGTIGRKLQESISVKDFGAAGDGTTDDTAAVQAALAASNAVYFPAGDYRITSTLTFNAAIVKKLKGDRARILCRAVTGPSFTFTCANGTFSEFEIDGLEFNGSLNGDNNWATASTTWTGLLSNSNAATVGGHLISKLQLNDCQVRFSNSTSAIGIDLKGVFFASAQNTRVSHFPYGYAALAGVVNNVSTTLTFQKCYFTYCRQCVEVGLNVSDVQFYDTVFESSVVAAALFKTKALFEGCYFENIGYSLDAAITTGKTIKGFGLSFGAGVLDTAVISALNIMYAEVNFNSCQFQYRNTTYASVTQPNAKYLLMVGRGSGSGAGGCARFVGCRVSNFNSTVFLESDANAASNYTDDNGCSFEWHQGSREYYLPYGDVRSIRYGSVYIEFPSTGSNPQYAMQAEVKRGLLVVPNSSFTTPVNSPVGGQWLRGDVLYSATPSAGGNIGSVCTASGTPGTWKTFGAIAP